MTLNRFFLWLQRDVDVTGNFIHFLILSKLKLGLELKQKFAPKPQIKNNSTYPCKCEKVPSFTIVELLKLGLELKQKFAPKSQITNNSTQPCKCEKVPSFTIVEFEGLA